MATLQMRDVPDELYQELVRQAEKERRSITQQAIVALEKGLRSPEDEKARRMRALRLAATMDRSITAKLPDPVKFIREDRDR